MTRDFTAAFPNTHLSALPFFFLRTSVCTKNRIELYCISPFGQHYRSHDVCPIAGTAAAFPVLRRASRDDIDRGGAGLHLHGPVNDVQHVDLHDRCASDNRRRRRTNDWRHDDPCIRCAADARALRAERSRGWRHNADGDDHSELLLSARESARSRLL